MDLRYRLAVVTGAGGALGREIAVALARAGAGVLSVDPDLAAAQATTDQVRAARVGAWALQADVGEEADLPMLAARARDLGGMDLLVNAGGWTPGGPPAPVRLTQLFVQGLAERRGRVDGTPAVVDVGPSAGRGGSSPGTRVMAVVPVPERLGRDVSPVPTTVVTRTVLDLLRHGYDGQVVELAGDPRPRPQA
jgi:3-oxoacyl-[acyl-carrier protein] reductase